MLLCIVHRVDRMSKFWLAASALLLFVPLSPAVGKAPSKTPARPAQAGIVGCWERTGEGSGTWKTSGQTVCFKRNGTIWGVSSDAGDGWDYGGTWRYRGPGKVSAQFPEVPPIVCSFWIDQAGDFLVTTGCTDNDWSNLWRRSPYTEKAVRL